MYKINSPFNFTKGDSPLLVSMPHSGVALLPGMEERLTTAAKPLPDTDWHIPDLYDFLPSMDVSTISANYSRLVVDLNRPIDDKPLYSTKTTGLFPDILFDGRDAFLPEMQHSDTLKEQIKSEIWTPYHQQISNELTRIKEKFGYAILFDAHSIAARLPMLFEGKLPDINFGTNIGLSCSSTLLTGLDEIIAETDYQRVWNGRFKGGYITRAYGQPDQNIHAIQLELSQDTYLVENNTTYQLDTVKKQKVSILLQNIITQLLIKKEGL